MCQNLWKEDNLYSATGNLKSPLSWLSEKAGTFLLSNNAFAMECLSFADRVLSLYACCA